MKKFLILVDPNNDGIQSNKYYNMESNGDTFTVKYGRVGQRAMTKTYSKYKWDSVLNSKLKKGYTDITHLKQENNTIVEESQNKDFNAFYDHFKSYTGSFVSNTYITDSCTKQQLEEAQNLLNELTKIKRIKKFNDTLIELYKVIPRSMRNVRDNLINNISEKNDYISREQDALDSMDSSNIIKTANPFDTLNIEFEEINTHKVLQDMVKSTMSGARWGTSNAKIHKIFKVTDKDRIETFDDWVKSQKNKQTQLLFHGTRNPNIFSILKSGLLIRPSNAYTLSGNIFGDGIYHSAHAAKSLGYTGGDNDKIFFIQDVHMGDSYTYKGWYRDGKDISNSEMNYKGLQKYGKDSLYVEAGDGLMNSEYIVYNNAQTITKFLIWFKQ